ncbi:uncharacterized protein LOC143027516 [Oratosquilla oratoria]|uniref:uncharacterized protein LOC143027516 n=1 Tax=Oratosquilla oratoria TaxID=337810 RepID=UPI003F76CFAC
MMVDFERTMTNSLHAVFNQTKIKACFSHFSQNTYRKVQASGMQQTYLNDQEFVPSMRMLAAYAFVPTAEIEETFDKLLEIMAPDSQPILDYFEDTYIRRPCRRRGRRESMFDMALWGMNDRTKKDLPRTNNSVEGWHQSFLESTGCYHPNIWIFISKLQKEQSLQEFSIRVQPALQMKDHGKGIKIAPSE